MINRTLRTANKEIRTPRRESVDAVLAELARREAKEKKQANQSALGLFYAPVRDNGEVFKYGRDIDYKGGRPSLNKMLPGLTFKELSAGVFGTTYIIEGDWKTAFKGLIKNPYKTTRNAVLSENWESFNPSKMLLKVQWLSDADSEKSAVFEDVVHRELYNSEHILFGLPIKGDEVVPGFAAGITVLGKATRVLRLTFMTVVAPSVTLRDYVGKNGVSAELYSKVERVIGFMWKSGFAHGDLHADNVLVKNGTPYLIDFGFVVRMPRHKVARMRSRISSFAFIDKLFAQEYLEHTKNVIVARWRNHPEFLNPDHMLLQELRRIGRVTEKAIREARGRMYL